MRVFIDAGVAVVFFIVGFALNGSDSHAQVVLVAVLAVVIYFDPPASIREGHFPASAAATPVIQSIRVEEDRPLALSDEEIVEKSGLHVGDRASCPSLVNRVTDVPSG